MCHCLSRKAPTKGLSLTTFTLVYELHGLTEEDAIVEGRLKHE